MKVIPHLLFIVRMVCQALEAESAGLILARLTLLEPRDEFEVAFDLIEDFLSTSDVKEYSDTQGAACMSELCQVPLAFIVILRKHLMPALPAATIASSWCFCQPLKMTEGLVLGVLFAARVSVFIQPRRRAITLLSLLSSLLMALCCDGVAVTKKDPVMTVAAIHFVRGFACIRRSPKLSACKIPNFKVVLATLGS